MNDTLREFIGKFVIIYLDDIIIYSNSYDEYTKYLSLIIIIIISRLIIEYSRDSD